MRRARGNNNAQIEHVTGDTPHGETRPTTSVTPTGSYRSPAVKVLHSIVLAYSPEPVQPPPATPTFDPADWDGLQPDPYVPRDQRDVLATRHSLEVELAAIEIAAVAARLPALADAHRTSTCCDRNQVKAAADTAARRVLARAVAIDEALRRCGLVGPAYAISLL